MPPNSYEIEIFLAGTRPASNGVSTTITSEHLQEVVDTYNPEYFRAPLIVSESFGHDIGSYSDKTISKSKELCHGIPKYLKRVGDRLYAGFEKVSRSFAQWVRDKEIHSVSSSFYLPNSPNNPYPGKWSLRHIAGLGTTPPACKGLAPLPEPPAEWQEAGGRRQEGFEPYAIAFNEQEEGVVDFGMGVPMMTSPWAIAADLFQRYREYLIESEDLETADRVLPSEAIAQLRAMAENDAWKDRQISDLQMQLLSKSDYDYEEEEEFEEMTDYKSLWNKSGMSPAEVAEASGLSEEEVTEICANGKAPSSKQKKALDKVFSSSDMSEREADLKAREEAIANRERALETQEVTSFVEGLVTSGRLSSGKKKDTITLLLNTPNTAEVEFSETLGKKTPRQALMSEYSSRAPWNYSEEIVRTEDSPKPVSFSAPRGYAVDEKSHRVYQQAIAYCEDKNLNPENYADWSRALDAVTEANGHG